MNLNTNSINRILNEPLNHNAHIAVLDGAAYERFAAWFAGCATAAVSDDGLPVGSDNLLAAAGRNAVAVQEGYFEPGAAAAVGTLEVVPVLVGLR